MINNNPDRQIALKTNDFISIWRMAFIDKLDHGKRVEEALRGFHRNDFEQDTTGRLFAATSSLSFIKHIINSVVFQNSAMSYGRLELFLCLPPPLFLVSIEYY